MRYVFMQLNKTHKIEQIYICSKDHNVNIQVVVVFVLFQYLY